MCCLFWLLAVYVLHHVYVCVLQWRQTSTIFYTKENEERNLNKSLPASAVGNPYFCTVETGLGQVSLYLSVLLEIDFDDFQIVRIIIQVLIRCWCSLSPLTNFYLSLCSCCCQQFCVNWSLICSQEFGKVIIDISMGVQHKTPRQKDTQKASKDTQRRGGTRG